MVNVARNRLSWLQASIVKQYGAMMRPEEVAGRLPGAFFFLLSTLVSLLVFEEPICRLAVLNLSFGDPVASVVGQTFGHQKQRRLALLAPGKTLEGALACFCVCSFLGLAWAGAVLGGGADLGALGALVYCIVVALVSGASSAFAEGVVPGLIAVDDNLCIPLVSGACLTLCAWAMRE